MNDERLGAHQWKLKSSVKHSVWGKNRTHVYGGGTNSLDSELQWRFVELKAWSLPLLPSPIERFRPSCPGLVIRCDLDETTCRLKRGFTTWWFFQSQVRIAPCEANTLTSYSTSCPEQYYSHALDLHWWISFHFRPSCLEFPTYILRPTCWSGSLDTGWISHSKPLGRLEPWKLS
jgi:hypothetical protein